LKVIDVAEERRIGPKRSERLNSSARARRSPKTSGGNSSILP
jgi:hypothetical protein